MKDRYLFTADRKASEYRGILEITPGRARLITPSVAARRVHWIVSVALGLSYSLVGSWVLTAIIYPAFPAPPVGWGLLVAVLALGFAGLVAVLLWWDRRSLPILADGAAMQLDLVLLGARSFGTYQDVRARTREGEELHLVVDTRATGFWEAVGLLEPRKTSSA